jgi:phosphate transport system substrate-binding protein
LRMLFFIIVALSLTLPATVFAEGILKIGGSGSSLGTMKLLAQAFEKSPPGVKVKVLASLGSAGAIKAISKKAIDKGEPEKSPCRTEKT